MVERKSKMNEITEYAPGRKVVNCDEYTIEMIALKASFSPGSRQKSD